MKLLTKNTDYAIRALLVLASKKGEFVSAREISKIQNMPYQYIRRILHVLILNKLTLAKEGISGGVMLNVSPGKIKLVDIIKLFQGSVQLSECMFRKKMCANRTTCVLRKKIINIERMVAKEFENITIKSLLNDLKKGA